MPTRRAERPGSAPVVDPQEAYFRALLENTSEVVVLADAAGMIRYISPAVERVLGHPPESRTGRSIFEWVHPDDAPQAVVGFTRFARGEADASTLALRMRHRTGGYRTLEIGLTNLLEHPSLSGVVLTARDVTERRQAEVARRQLTAILDATPDFVFTCDPNGRILYVNAAAQRLLGISPDEVRSSNLSDFYPGWAGERLLAEAIPITLREGVWRGELALLEPSGAEVPVSQVLVAHRGDGGGVEFLSATGRDISESKRAEVALRDSEERFRQVAENIEEVFWLLDCDGWRMLFVSPAFERVWGRDCAGVVGDTRTLLEAVHPADRDEVPTDMEAFFTGESELQYRIIRPDGAVRWIRSRNFPVRNHAGEVYRVAGISEDITERKETEEHLRHMALHDSLTGLPNRAALINRLMRSLERVEHQPRNAFSVLFVDLDRFKLINDSLGHLKGDELLRAISRRLEICVRPEDMVARLAGDEFAVLLVQTPRVADAARVAERILDSFAEPFTVGSHQVFAGASIGIVPSGGYTHPEDVLRDADIAMYRAKMGGRGNYRVFDAAMHADVVSRLALETDLRRALDRGEFQLQFQPVVALKSGRIAGVEALLRWKHPERGEITPTEFITIAEEIGVIIPLGWWAVREACLQMAQWTADLPDYGDLSVSVNLSGKHFSQPNLVRKVREILEETRVDPRRLKLEITESVIIDNSQAARAAFDGLRSLGIELHIDDFGTGYSSLSYLDRFPIDSVKIDRSLVARIGPTGEGGEIVNTVVKLAQDLGMTVVAEGVETFAQLQQLRSVGCDFAQGFLFSRAVDAHVTEELLRNTPHW